LLYARRRELLQLEIPPKAQWMRVMLTELTRLTATWCGWGARDRHRRDECVHLLLSRAEEILRIFEMFPGSV